MPIDARQVGRQRRALGAALRLSGLLRVEQLLELGFDGRDVGVDCLVEQRPLFSVELLALLTELDALQLRHLEGELVQLGVAPVDLAPCMLQLLHQARAQCTQARGFEAGQFGSADQRSIKHWPQCARLVRCCPLALAPIATAATHTTVMTPP